jgi:hypothetical protein
MASWHSSLSFFGRWYFSQSSKFIAQYNVLCLVTLWELLIFFYSLLI